MFSTLNYLQTSQVRLDQRTLQLSCGQWPVANLSKIQSSRHHFQAFLLRGIYSSNRPGFLPQLFFAHAQIAPVFFPNFFSLTLKKIEFLAQTPLIITFYCIFKLQFFENCPKKLNFCPKIGKIRYVPVCFPIFVQMYRFLSPPPFSFLEEYIPLNQTERFTDHFFKTAKRSRGDSLIIKAIVMQNPGVGGSVHLQLFILWSEFWHWWQRCGVIEMLALLTSSYMQGPWQFLPSSAKAPAPAGLSWLYSQLI